MKAEVESLFHELADLPVEARSRYFAEHEVDEDTRREVERLLSFDSGESSPLESDIRAAASRALENLEGGGWLAGPYRLLELLGRGGMGAVYLAERVDGEVTQRCAVKLLPAGASDPLRERFLQERQILASLTHANIARMLDAGHLPNGQPFLAMEYVDGKPIDEFVAELSARQKIQLFLKVCAAVGYLHRNLIVHRDLKPGNILVTAEGEPKLLDFGIAKMLDLATDSTVTCLRMLTPDYASPEQVTGGPISTATDIYSLGAVLYRLLTGRPPHEFTDRSAEGIARSITGGEVARPSTIAPELKGDLEFILLKSMRKEAQDRYGTVEQFAEDLQAFLEWRPVRARSGNAWYVTRKFVRRYWVPVTAAALVMTSLAVGLEIVNHERAVAQRRFEQVRTLANKVLALDDVVRDLPGSTKARSEIVAMSQAYLEGLDSESPKEPGLALEIASAYFALARVQGIPIAANLGQFAQAEVSLRKAEALLEGLLKQNPNNRKALFLSAEVAHDRMILASTDRRKEDTLRYAREAATRMDTFLGMGGASATELRGATRVFANIALANKNLHIYDAAARYARRAIEVARMSPTPDENLAQPLSVLADALRLSGDLDGALRAIREARTSIEKTDFRGDIPRRLTMFNVLWREGSILGQDDNVSLDRPAEAEQVFQQAFDLMEEWAQKDPHESHSRILVSTAARELGRIVAHRDPQRALAIYDKALTRLREATPGNDTKRDAARLLAYSGDALLKLHRKEEAKARVDQALALLRETKDYPGERLEPEGEVCAAMRAWGDWLAASGEWERDREVLGELLAKLGEGATGDLRNSAIVSALYERLAEADRRTGRKDEADGLDARRLSLWRKWQQKFPGLPFVARQAALASGKAAAGDNLSHERLQQARTDPVSQP
ncbi:MAG TPA: serine/threonine-protein kinase [Bryobacteraceae bacterium]|jgi:tetratricopeptide (TPR) repeat protein/predicted Ser/Thr protein kinase